MTSKVSLSQLARVVSARSTRSSTCLLKCFTEADNEGASKIGPDKFDGLVDIAAFAPHRFGFAPPAAEAFKSAAEKSAARKAMFEKMDTDGVGFISFEEWFAHLRDSKDSCSSSVWERA